jgi:hypothetical protein
MSVHKVPSIAPVRSAHELPSGNARPLGIMRKSG